MKEDRLTIIVSPEADRDLLDIWDYVCGGSSRAIADKQLSEIDRVLFVVSGWPEYGRARDDVDQGLRSVPVGRYVIFYRITDAIEIVRVLDERRDIEIVFSERIEIS